MNKVVLLLITALTFSCSTLRISPSPMDVPTHEDHQLSMIPEIAFPERVSPTADDSLFLTSLEDDFLLPGFPVKPQPRLSLVAGANKNGAKVLESPALIENETLLLPSFPEVLTPLPTFQPEAVPATAQAQESQSAESIVLSETATEIRDLPRPMAAVEEEVLDEPIRASISGLAQEVPTSTESRDYDFGNFPDSSHHSGYQDPMDPWESNYLPDSHSRTYAPTMELHTSIDEEIIIQLEGPGWILTSSAPDGQWSAMGPLPQGDLTQFIVEPKEEGEFLLEFLGQNPSTGETSNITYTLNILGEDSSLEGREILDQNESQSLILARELFDRGQYQELVDFTGDMGQEMVPEMRYMLAVSKEKTGHPSEARNLLGRNLTYSKEDPWVGQSRHYLSDLLLSGRQYASWAQLVLEDNRPNQAPSEKDYLRALEGLLGESSEPMIRQMIENFSVFYPNPSHEDEFLYLWAQYLEQSGPDRNLRRARDLYQIVLDHHIFSPRYIDASSRASYLDRNFFYYR